MRELDLRQFPICLCYFLWGMVFRCHCKNFKYTPDGLNTRVFGTMERNHKTPQTTLPHWGLIHRTLSTYIYIKIEHKFPKRNIITQNYTLNKKKTLRSCSRSYGGGGVLCSPFLLRIYLKLKFIALFFPFTAKVFVSRAFSDTQHRYILNEQ